MPILHTCYYCEAQYTAENSDASDADRFCSTRCERRDDLTDGPFDSFEEE